MTKRENLTKIFTTVSTMKKILIDGEYLVDVRIIFDHGLGAGAQQEIDLFDRRDQTKGAENGREKSRSPIP